jgi:hypothetical protein
VIARDCRRLRGHRPAVAALAVGAGIRAVVTVRDVPAVFQDSLVYLRMAATTPVGIDPARPSGYPMLLWLVRRISPDLRWVVGLQHVAGVAAAALVYVLMLRLGTQRWLATTVVALIVLDGYVLALEQAILAEALFLLAIVVCVASTATAGGSRAAAVSGAALAVAITMRTAGLFAVPVWLAALAGRRLGRQRSLAALAGLVVPLVGYGAFHAHAGDGWALTRSDGWFLYGRIGAIVNCDGASVPDVARPLCAAPTRLSPVTYVFEPTAPAHQVLGPRMTAENNGTLRAFAFGVIRAHPGRYARLVTRDVLRAFSFGGGHVGSEMALYGPNDVAHGVPRRVHVPRPLLGALTLAVLTGLGLNLASRRAPPVRWSAVFVAATGLALLVRPHDALHRGEHAAHPVGRRDGRRRPRALVARLTERAKRTVDSSVGTTRTSGWRAAGIGGRNAGSFQNVGSSRSTSGNHPAISRPRWCCCARTHHATAPATASNAAKATTATITAPTPTAPLDTTAAGGATRAGPAKRDASGRTGVSRGAETG